MEKKGFELSFSMIFSIIVIVAIIGIAFYVINYFLDLGECTEVSMFYRDFQQKIDSAWNSEITRDEFVGSLPGGIESVCLGNLSRGGSGEEYEEMRAYERFNFNIFLFPGRKSCEMARSRINHLDTADIGLTCFPVENGEVRIGIEKGSFDSLVKIRR